MNQSPPSGQEPTPADPSAAVARRLTEFGSALAGTLRPGSIVDLLIAHVRETFTPSVVAVSIYADDAAGPPEVHSWPTGAGWPEGIQALERDGPGRLVVSGNDTWCLAPLRARGQVTGTVAIRDPSGPFASIAHRHCRRCGARPGAAGYTADARRSCAPDGRAGDSDDAPAASGLRSDVG